MRDVTMEVFVKLAAAGMVLSSGSGCAAGGRSPGVERRVQAFYYPWYGNPATDGAWSHWNHPVLLREGGGKPFEPPENIGANFYPELGLTSSKSRADLAAHMQQLKRAGIGVICLSWWGRGSFTDQATPLVLDVAAAHGITCNFHIEPYGGRGAQSVGEDLKYIYERYGGSPGFYRDPDRGDRGMFYVYDSYLTKAAEWATLLRPEGERTIRGTELDAIVIGLWVKQDEEAFMGDGGFDGFYTYFATEGFTYGSTPANWKRLAAWAQANGKIFIPSVGPGYDDTRIRPWNTKNRREREGGAYYDRMWAAALACRPAFVSITSFNEWHEGTQIEPAVPKAIDGYRYEDYAPRESGYYLERTRTWVGRMARRR